MKKLLSKILLFLSFVSFSQVKENDTIVYNGFFKDCFLMESYTLYPDNTFKWTSEFDLSYDEYGEYNLEDGILKFDFYIDLFRPKNMPIKDSISILKNTKSKPIRTVYLEIDDENLYYVNKNEERAPTKRKAPCKRTFGWLFGNKFKYIIYKVNDNIEK